MKVKQLYPLLVLLLFLIPKANFAHTDLSTAESVDIASPGDIGSISSPITIGDLSVFENMSGITYDTDGAGTERATNSSAFYNELNTAVANFSPSGATRNDDLTSNGQGVSTTPFIKGKSARGPNSGVKPENKARACDEVITSQPVDSDVCNGTSITFNVAATGVGLTYQWRRDGVDLNEGPNVIGSNTPSLTLDNVSPGDEGMYSVVITTTCPSTLTSADAELTVHVPVAISKEPAGLTLCEGGQAIFDINATGGPQVNYQWRIGTTNLVDGGNISGANTQVLTIDPVTMADAAADYNVVVTGLCPVMATSIDAALIVDQSVNITAQPANLTICEGSAATFTVGTTGSGLTYQWRIGNTDLVDGGNISGATTATLTIDPATAADIASDYNVVVSSAGACPPGTMTSADANLNVGSPVNITMQPLDLDICEGSAANFTVVATGTGLTYQWRQGTNNMIDGGRVSGATTATLTLDPTLSADASADYNVIVTGTCDSETSTNADLTVNTSPVITVQPADQTVCENGTTNLTVNATGTNLTYQWRRGVINLIDGANISGSNSSTLTINPVGIADAGADYNVVVSGDCPSSVTSLNADVVVNAATDITVQPITETVCEGDAASFTVGATGAGLTYQWRQGTNNMIDGGRISGATTATLTFDPTMSGDASADYNVIVTGTCGNETSVNTTLNIDTAPVITSQPGNQTLCAGNTATFNVVATGAGLTYQWRKNGINLADGGSVSGSTTATLTIDNITVADIADYSVVVSGTCPGTATSANASLTINLSPIITLQPSNQTVCEGNAATFTVNASGSGLTYQWRQGTSGLVNGGNISGATSSTLIIDPATSADASTDYNVVITGGCPLSSTSADATLTINTAPVITVQPIDVTVCEGSPATLSVNATGTGLTYQWRQGTNNMINGARVSGATAASVTFDPTLSGDASADYNVIVTGTCGVETSVNTNLTIDISPAIALQPTNQIVCEGGTATFNVGATGTGLTYQWRRNGINLADGGDISGSATASLSVANASVADQADYSVVISGACPAAVTSVDATLTIGTAPVITLQPDHLYSWRNRNRTHLSVETRKQQHG
jgi:hypothetical protein